MANPVIPLPGGIRLNSSQKGYLDIEEHVLSSLINPHPITSVYDVEQTPFARGKFASVKKCTSKETGIQYAAKFIRKRRRAMDHRQDILHEVAILKLASECSKIVTLHEVFETSMEMILVLEFSVRDRKGLRLRSRAAGGELQRIVDVQEGLGEAETIRILKQILLGLQFLHDRNIAHLDIKPQNILLTGNDPGSDIKLCDFGISRIIQNGVDVREILGTPDYIAPEILSYEPISLETDVWSIGVLAYVLLTGYSPFGGETKQETFCNISQCNLTFPEEFFSGISTSAQDFIMETLVTAPNERLSVSRCFNHPWLSGISTYSLTESTKILKTSSASFQLPCLTCSQCNTLTQCCHNDKEKKESSEKSQVMNGLKPPVDILLDRSILC